MVSTTTLLGGTTLIRLAVSGGVVTVGLGGVTLGPKIDFSRLYKESSKLTSRLILSIGPVRQRAGFILGMKAVL